MPGRDHTGPEGKGSRTGRGLGNCGTAARSNEDMVQDREQGMDQPQTMGLGLAHRYGQRRGLCMGNGQGQGRGKGRGQGQGRGMGQCRGSGMARAGNAQGAAQPDKTSSAAPAVSVNESAATVEKA
ncbi:DUF5320 domain-containing protein [Desulfovibrio legallii]|uniref:Uncharacterized protein n=1 Tax=Desulfovibrio legallii TaxID=571438 RepID=A0A6H3F433_9BACT|nr:DUF5320 domain-containing protein [Desulfovibrio legallii]TBH79117.1 hypothetical protein EB812_08960 [Desulfovibrio legallii]